ncbi:MAG: FliG C-terminal domain-containing protein [Pseudomonadota bacterium]
MAERPAVAPADDLPGEGAQRAAAVLLGVGAELAAQIFRMLDEVAVRRIALGARELRRNPASVGTALKTFVDAMATVGGDAVAGDGMLRDVATRALGPDAARRAFDGVAAPPAPDDGLGAIAHADAESLAVILAREQPQTVALVLGSLTPNKAAAVVKLLPERLRPPVLRRLATLESVAPEVLREVGQALTSELRTSSMGEALRVDGKAAAIDLLRRCPAAQQTEVVAEIEKDDPDLASELRGKLFTFEDLSNLSDRDVQTLLRDVNTTRLAVALKGATAAVKEKILRNMSSRAAQMLEEEIGGLGPMRLSAVEEAQGELVKAAFALAEQGRITIVGPADRML